MREAERLKRRPRFGIREVGQLATSVQYELVRDSRRLGRAVRERGGRLLRVSWEPKVHETTKARWTECWRDGRLAAGGNGRAAGDGSAAEPVMAHWLADKTPGGFAKAEPGEPPPRANPVVTALASD